MRSIYFPRKFKDPAEEFIGYCSYRSPNYMVLEAGLGFNEDFTLNIIQLRCPKKIIHISTPDEPYAQILPICIFDTVTRETSLNNMSKKGRFYVRKTDSTTWHKAIWPIKMQPYATTSPGLIRSFSLVYNLCEYFDFFFNGRYEIYCERSGVESNHCFVNIIERISII